MAKCVLFIDGENFLHKVEEVLKQEGVEKSPNKGLTYTTNRTILLRNHEVVEACKTKKSTK